METSVRYFFFFFCKIQQTRTANTDHVRRILLVIEARSFSSCLPVRELVIQSWGWSINIYAISECESYGIGVSWGSRECKSRKECVISFFETSTHVELDARCTYFIPCLCSLQSLRISHKNTLIPSKKGRERNRYLFSYQTSNPTTEQPWLARKEQRPTTSLNPRKLPLIRPRREARKRRERKLRSPPSKLRWREKERYATYGDSLSYGFRGRNTTESLEPNKLIVFQIAVYNVLPNYWNCIFASRKNHRRLDHRNLVLFPHVTQCERYESLVQEGKTRKVGRALFCPESCSYSYKVPVSYHRLGKMMWFSPPQL